MWIFHIGNPIYGSIPEFRNFYVIFSPWTFHAQSFRCHTSDWSKLGAWKMMVLLKVCLYNQFNYTILCCLCKKRPSACQNSFVHVVFNISVLHVSKFSLSVWCTTLVAINSIKKVCIKPSKIMLADQLRSTVKLLVLHASCIFGWRWLVQGVCTRPCACCFGICKIL